TYCRSIRNSGSQAGVHSSVKRRAPRSQRAPMALVSIVHFNGPRQKKPQREGLVHRENTMTQLTRRAVLAGAAAATALSPLATIPSAKAAAPLAGKQAPGWYR